MGGIFSQLVVALQPALSSLQMCHFFHLPMILNLIVQLLWSPTTFILLMTPLPECRASTLSLLYKRLCNCKQGAQVSYIQPASLHSQNHLSLGAPSWYTPYAWGNLWPTTVVIFTSIQILMNGQDDTNIAEKFGRYSWTEKTALVHSFVVSQTPI